MPDARINPGEIRWPAGTALLTFTGVTEFLQTEAVAVSVAQSSGDVGIGFNLFVNSSWVRFAEKLFSWNSSMPTCTRDFPRTLNAPKRRPRRTRAFGRTSASPHLGMASICAAAAPAAPPLLRKIKYGRGSKNDT